MYAVMDFKQRVLNAISHKAFSNLPFQLDVTDATLENMARAWGFKKSEDAKYTVLQNHLVFARLKYPRSGADEKSDSLNSLQDVWGVQWASDLEGAWVIKHPFERIDDLRKYTAPSVSTLVSWDDVVEKKEKYGEKFCIVGYQNALLFERAWSLVGFERIMVEMLSDLAGLESFLDHITDAQMAVAERFVSYGIDVARTGDDWGGQNNMLFSPALWRRLIKPRLANIWSIYQKNHIPIIHHSCGDIRLILDDLVDMGLEVINPVQPEAMPIEDIAERYGKSFAFYGGISEQKVLPFGTEKEVKEEVERSVRLLGSDGGYIIAPSQAITSDVPIENIEVLFETMQKF
jgi:uroporphyrinogen decarboxylase